VVELASNTAEEEAADDAPTITFPLTVALVKVPVIFEAATSVTFAFVIAPSAIEAVVIAPSVMVVAFPTEVTGPVKFAFVVTVAALPPILKLATGVVDVTTNGAVPVATVEVNPAAVTVPLVFTFVTLVLPN
jgi:hypothetical protein